MKKCALLLSLVVALTGCVSARSGVVNRQYVHKYGFCVGGEDWDSRGGDGQVISTLETGERVTQNYVAGQLHGDTTTTYPHSTIVAKTESYEQGQLLRVAKHNTTGWPQSEERFLSDGSSERVIWYENGAPQAVERIRDNRLLTGEYYTPTNQLESRVDHSEGVKIVRDAYGTHIKNQRITDGEVTAEDIYHPNGILASETPYKKGVIEGVRLTYLPSGEPNTSETWSGGRQQGLTVVYQNGQVWREVPYVNGMKEGVETVYRDGNQVVEEISWMGDLQHGPHKRYIGNVVKSEWYYKGELMPRPMNVN